MEKINDNIHAYVVNFPENVWKELRFIALIENKTVKDVILSIITDKLNMSINGGLKRHEEENKRV